MTIASVGELDREAFIKLATEEADERIKAWPERQAGTVWERARTVRDAVNTLRANAQPR